MTDNSGKVVGTKVSRMGIKETLAETLLHEGNTSRKGRDSLSTVHTYYSNIQMKIMGQNH